MKKPWEYMLCEIEVAAKIELNAEVLAHVQALKDWIISYQKTQQTYKVAKVIEMRRVENNNRAVEKRGVSLDTGLINACVLVSE